jgi:hypothetical protein
MAMDNLLPNHKPNGTGLIIPFSSPVQCNDDTTPRLLPARPSAVSIDSPDDMASLSSPYTTRKITHESINETTTSSCHKKPSHSQLTALLHAPTASAAKLLLSNNEMLARAVNKNRCMGSASLDGRKRMSGGGNKQTKKLDAKLNNSSCMDSYNALQEEMDEEVCIHDEIRMSDEELAEKQSETREEKRLNETVLEQQIKSEEEKQIKGTLLEQTNPALNKMPQFKTWTLHSQKNEEEINTEPSLDLAEFPYNSPSHVSVSSEEEDAATKDVDASTPCLVSPSSSSANTENKKKPQSLDKPRTILDYAAAKTNETTPIEKATYLDCPLTFFSRVCHDSALSIPTFIKSNYNPSNETGKHKVVYPMNFVEDEGSTVMLTYIDIPHEVSSTEVQLSGTELLLHAAASEEYTESKRLQRCKKRKAADSIISLRDLGDLMKKQKSEETEPNNVEMSTMNQSTSSDPLARQAFLLADQALKDESILKQLLLSMTMERDWTRPKAGIDEPQRGHILQKSFLWSSIPTMELVLIRHMKEYYYYSMGDKCMTKEQLEFNSRLLLDVKKCAEDMGWVWGEEFDTDRKIRNRIRCYYKVSLCCFDCETGCLHS